MENNFIIEYIMENIPEYSPFKFKPMLSTALESKITLFTTTLFLNCLTFSLCTVIFSNLTLSFLKQFYSLLVTVTIYKTA